MKPLLVAVDFSDCAHAVVADADALAGRLGTELVLLHVVEGHEGLGLSTRLDRSGRTAGQVLAAEAQELLGTFATTVPAQTVVRAGPVVSTIHAAAEEVGAEMIVMGTHGRRGMAHLVLGSVAQKVVATAKVPVLTVRAQHRPSCEAANCNWCSSRTPMEEQMGFEADG